jgi:CMD domain protein
MHTDADIINAAAGIAPGSPLDKLRDARKMARENAQKSVHLLFDSGDGDASLVERLALGVFVTTLHGSREISQAYAGELAGIGDHPPAPALMAALQDELKAALRPGTQGPYGIFPAGPLSAENLPGPVYAVSAANRPALGERLAAALEHGHLLTFHPRDAGAEHLQKLLNAGWSPTGIVVISEIIAFLAYQVRVAHGLEALKNFGGTDERSGS